ncbi:MAG: TonB family protein [Candidatus Sulfotelmatobacter sp.]
MALRCLLFSSDEGTAEPIRQVLAGLGVEGESCSDAAAAVEQVTHQSFQIVIIDWDMQPESGQLLTAARERKAAERPLTLAIVSDDVSVPKALQAGANSILRKPLQVNQVRDTLTTARDLLRAKQESTAAQAAAAGASAGPSSMLPASMDPGKEKTLRAGEFLHAGPPAPGGQFVTESDAHACVEQSLAAPVDPLKDLEPMAASVAVEKPLPPPPPPPGEPRGLEWYLKTRAGTLPTVPAHAPAPPVSSKPELLGFDQTPSYPSAPPASSNHLARPPDPDANQNAVQEQKKEAVLFAYMAGESTESEDAPRSRFRFKGAIIGALVLAVCAVVAAPQAPWHPKFRIAWTRGKQALHAWLNPQPVTPVQAPAAHEDFGRAGDEYKLPVAENIPDATTDPSQIHVLPVIDPTAKKPNNEGANPDQSTAPTDTSAAPPTDQAPASGTQVPASQPSATPETTQPSSGPGAGGASTSAVPIPSPSPVVAAPAAATAPRPDPFTPSSPSASAASPAPAQPIPPRTPTPHNATPPANVPSSLKSQMASMTPDASGNKPAEAAMASIEPVAVSELSERALLTDQPPLDYPASARGQQGTVILQVLIGRDGVVQDAKFMQGSLAFARAAIDGVRQWRFKPYAMNGRAVSVQTQLTINFKPAS